MNKQFPSLLQSAEDARRARHPCERCEIDHPWRECNIDKPVTDKGIGMKIKLASIRKAL